jgi:hypothetical protein
MPAVAVKRCAPASIPVHGTYRFRKRHPPRRAERQNPHSGGTVALRGFVQEGFCNGCPLPAHAAIVLGISHHRNLNIVRSRNMALLSHSLSMSSGDIDCANCQAARESAGNVGGDGACLPGVAIASGARRHHTYAMAGADEIAVLRIELQGIEPLIWRRVAIRTATSMTNVHRVIQAAMGWLDSHLWEFQANGRKYAMLLPDDPDWNERFENAETVSLAMLLATGVRQMEYVYDMGDYWEHLIIAERLTAPLPEVRYPQFLGGERRCPPADCGGPFGYSEFLRKISSKQSKTRKAALDWHGRPYDPDDISEQKIITGLGRIASGRPER